MSLLCIVWRLSNFHYFYILARSTHKDARIMVCGSDGLSDFLLQNGLRSLLLAVLLAVTIFRREISCNHCYAEEETTSTAAASAGEETEEEETTSSATAKATAAATNVVLEHQWDDREADSILEGASSCFGSAASAVYQMIFHACYVLFKIVLPYRLAHSALSSLSQWWLVAAERQSLEEILDGAEHWRTSPPRDIFIVNSHFTANGEDSEAVAAVKEEKENAILFPNAPENFPTDAAVHILSFLQPKDVLSFGCVSPETQAMVREDAPIWKMLWLRDYSWLISSWEVGQEAVQRSLKSIATFCGGNDKTLNTASSCPDDTIARFLGSFQFSKDFYFRFGLSFVDYLLAGQCTTRRCLVGLGGHVFDLTAFVEDHPGSPETVLAHAGKDCTAVFEGMRHTIGARKMAQQMCVVVDSSRNGMGFGVRPTAKIWSKNAPSSSSTSSSSLPAPASAPSVSVIPSGRPQKPVAAAAEAVRRDFLQEQSECMVRASRMKETGSASDAMSNVHAYYDPFCGKWKAWYLDSTFEPVFVEDIVVTSSKSFFF